jgi:hypothetical protein
MTTRTKRPEGGPPAPGDRLHLPTATPPSAEVVPIVSSSRRAELLALSHERDLWLRRVLDAWREGYQAALSDAVVESLLRVYPAAGHVSEIEKRRYPPDGREHFADPRPGDYTGGPVACNGRRRS